MRDPSHSSLVCSHGCLWSGRDDAPTPTAHVLLALLCLLLRKTAASAQCPPPPPLLYVYSCNLNVRETPEL